MGGRMEIDLWNQRMQRTMDVAHHQLAATNQLAETKGSAPKQLPFLD